jgi:two-component system aerobic respiration control sensor histidine kinase ArcB
MGSSMDKKKINKQKEVKELEALISCLPGHYYWKDTEGRYLGCSEGFLKILGMDSKHLVGKTDNQLWPDQAALLKAYDAQILTSKRSITIEETITLENGEQKILLVTRAPREDAAGNTIGIIGNLFDITNQKKKEIELKNNLKEMEFELKKAKEESLAENKTKIDFLENMRLNICSSISSISSTAHLIKNETENLKVHEYADILVNSSHAMQDFLACLLEDIRVSSKAQLFLNKLSLKSILVEAVKFSRLKAVERKIDLKFEHDEKIPQYLLGDPKRVHRIILELLMNALSIVESRQIKLSTKLVKQNDTNIVVKVVVEIINEKTEFQDIFTCLIPLQKLPLDIDPNKNSSDNKITPQEVPEFTNRTFPDFFTTNQKKIKTGPNHILIVEDHPITAKITKAILDDLSCQVDIAINGEDAILKIENEHYDLVLMDIGLPDIDGCEVTRQIRLYESTQGGHHIPIVGLTARVDIENKQRCIDAGMNAVFSKPLIKEKIQEIFMTFVPKYYTQKVVEVSISKRQKSENNSNVNKKTTEKSKKRQESLIVDLKLGAHLIGGDEKIAKEAIVMMVESFPDELIKLETAYRTSNWKDIEMIVHKLRGGTSYCGTPRLKEACVRLDDYLQSGQTAAIGALYQQLLDEIETLEHYIEKEEF